jgi:hypothetical protein
MPYASVFLSLIVLSFGAVTFFSGLFAAYFGAGKSRKIGLGLTLVGLLALTFFASATWEILPGLGVDAWTPEDALLGVLAVIGASIGGAFALALFLVSIMKSG